MEGTNTEKEPAQLVHSPDTCNLGSGPDVSREPVLLSYWEQVVCIVRLPYQEPGVRSLRQVRPAIIIIANICPPVRFG